MKDKKSSRELFTKKLKLMQMDKESEGLWKQSLSLVLLQDLYPTFFSLSTIFNFGSAFRLSRKSRLIPSCFIRGLRKLRLMLTEAQARGKEGNPQPKTVTTLAFPFLQHPAPSYLRTFALTVPSPETPFSIFLEVCSSSSFRCQHSRSQKHALPQPPLSCNTPPCDLSSIGLHTLQLSLLLTCSLASPTRKSAE